MKFFSKEDILLCFLILVSSFVVFGLFITAGGVMLVGFSPMACDAGCNAAGKWGAVLLGFSLYTFVIFSLLGWYAYHKKAVLAGYFFTLICPLLYVLVIIVCSYLNIPANRSYLNTPTNQISGQERYTRSQSNSSDIDAGPISNQHDAGIKCPKLCQRFNSDWTGNWNTPTGSSTSVCNCRPKH